ncbi:MAG: methylenetetrahydrofolate reductase [Oscillospiraceae bacterium]|jgi:methylenetetrahydrofolate reductase (NADPH)|nr:methylenetetrahydrofolate reductase [Oscillospiraceae bacterium]
MKKFTFEVFPPNKNYPEEKLYPALYEFAAMKPDSISVTYSAGGTGGGETEKFAAYIVNKLNTPSVAHLTCLNSSITDIDAELTNLYDSGVTSVMALRGDKVAGETPTGKFKYASELVAHIRQSHPRFTVYGACYPECHSECDNLDLDVEHLAIKAQAGVSALYSQLFFDNAAWFRFADKARAKGITIPLYPGIMPITSANQIKRMVSLSGASLPPKFTKLLAKFGGSTEALFDAGCAYAVEQIAELLANDADGIHLYTMNRPAVARRIGENVRHLFL